jgi:hypothetical protein
MIAFTVILILMFNIKTESVNAKEVRGNSKICEKKITHPINNNDGTVSFMNQTWTIIKEMGNGNLMIALTNSVGTSVFSTENAEGKCSYYVSSSLSSTNDGYKDSLVKQEVDNWYNKNIRGSDYEKFVVPVYIDNPTFFDMKILGWESHNIGKISIDCWRKNIIAPNSYPTKVEYSYGSKQAFIMSGSDLAEKNLEYPDDIYYEGALTKAAFNYRNRLNNNGIKYSWLRSPSFVSFGAAGLYAGESRVVEYVVAHRLSIVPALVIHIEDNKCG